MKDFPKGELIYIFVYDGKTYGVWVNFKSGGLFVSTKYNPNCPCSYTFTTENMKPNLLTGKMVCRGYHGELTKFAYNTGCLFYESLAIKDMFYDIARICNF